MIRSLLVAAALAAAATGQTYTLTPFGTACGGTLHAQVAARPAGASLHAGITGAHPMSPAVLVLGAQLTVPTPLPGGCTLLLDPRLTIPGRTDANGSARFALRLPPIVPLSISLQGVVIGRRPGGRVVDATGGVLLVVS